MAKADPRDFLLNTDYGMDKIIYVKEYKATITTPTNMVPIPHGLPTAPLIFGIWSLNADYTDSHNLGDGEVDPNFNQGPTCFGSADMENVYLSFVPNSNSGGYLSTDFYVRVFGFEPSSNWIDTIDPNDNLTLKGKKIAPTSKYAKKFILNTDYNYLKLVKGGLIEETYDSTDQSYQFTHKLGYVPQALLWETLGAYQGNIEFTPLTGTFTYGDSASTFTKTGYFIDDEKVYSYMGIVPHATVIRLYGDEA
ncbi:hypothetical protein IKF88_00665 [Candidatus Saccharibacteria bacterium]|nr:hypothetical protein [Candidatus Saccharibacteria bacterium]